MSNIINCMPVQLHGVLDGHHLSAWSYMLLCVDGGFQHWLVGTE